MNVGKPGNEATRKERANNLDLCLAVWAVVHSIEITHV